LYYQGRYEEAAKAAKRSVQMLTDRYERAASLVMVGTAWTHGGKLRSAFAAFHDADEIAKDFKDDVYLWSHLYGNRALAYERSGKPDKAIIDWEGAAQLFRENRYLWRAAIYVNNIGDLLTKLGRFDEAEQRLLEALELIEQDPEPHTEGVIYGSLGRLYALTGQEFNAERFLRKSKSIFEKVGDKDQLVTTLLHFSEFYQLRDEFAASVDYAERALELALEIGSEALEEKARDCFKGIALAQLDDRLSDYFELHRRNCSLVKRVLKRKPRPGFLGPIS
jgi:tetratricopeptide (TPR) repeat protein